jgi:50S ribosomal protein L16 3-hydroxylase
VSGAGFWPDFASHYYGREPLQTDKAEADLDIGPEEMFRLLLRAAAARDSGPAGPRIRFHIGQRQVIADLANYLPVAADGSLDGYVARLERQLGGESYLLVVERAQVSSRPVWQAVARFLSSLYAATGALPGNVDVEAFVGRYPHTIPGIHRERSSVFVSMVQGTKDILVWPPDQTGLPLGSSCYQDAVAGARRLRCEPGQLVYWPAMHWHVGESPAQCTVGLHIAVLDEPPTVRDLLGDTSELDAAVAPPAIPGWSAAEPHDLALPPGLDAAVESVVAAYSDAQLLTDRLIAGWLRRRTALGLSAAPLGRKVSLHPDDVVVRDGVHPIVLAPRDSATSWLAADGRVGYARSVPSLVRLVDWLNCGEPVSVAAALGLAASPLDRKVLMQALNLLASWRALASGGTTQRVPGSALAAGSALAGRASRARGSGAAMDARCAAGGASSQLAPAR